MRGLSSVGTKKAHLIAQMGLEVGSNLQAKSRFHLRLRGLYLSGLHFHRSGTVIGFGRRWTDLQRGLAVGLGRGLFDYHPRCWLLSDGSLDRRGLYLTGLTQFCRLLTPYDVTPDEYLSVDLELDHVAVTSSHCLYHGRWNLTSD